MPLRDHFRPPFSTAHSWEEIHGQWPAVIVQNLTRQLPPEYSAAPRVHLGAEFEVDVATYESGGPSTRPASHRNEGGAATAVWAPAAPTFSVQTELAEFDEYEVRVYDMRRNRRLVAAIELISPSNKDRPEQRSQFASKCAALLRQGVSLALVDVVTIRRANLYADMLELVDERDPACGDSPPATYAAACRFGYRGEGLRLETWHHALQPGQLLPTLPLWLSEELAVPLDLEATYEQTCRDLRIA